MINIVFDNEYEFTKIEDGTRVVIEENSLRLTYSFKEKNTEKE